MLAEDLVRMANQIAQFFAAYPDDDAIEGVRDHLLKFWDPAMRKELLAIANGLTPTTTPLHVLVLVAHGAIGRDQLSILLLHLKQLLNGLLEVGRVEDRKSRGQ